jgi:putative hydrolase of the HAD superfamily
MSPRVEAIVFDLGGVLIELDFDSAYREWARCAGVAAEDIRGRFRFDQSYERYERGETELADFFASLRRLLEIDIPDSEFERGWCSIFPGEVKGMRELLERLRGRVPLYVFSNTNLSHQRAWSAQFAELLRPFDRVFTSNELRKRKPTPEAFHAVAQAIDVPPERVLFFDDSLANVQGALSVGMQAIHVSSIRDVERALRDRDLA